MRRAQRRATGLAVRTTLESLAHAGKLHPEALRWRREVDVIRDIPYGDGSDPAHRLDVYRPRGARGPLPVRLYVHGGGFVILSKDTHWMFGYGFARRGWLVLSIDYRLAPRAPFPAALEDAAEAYAWVVARAADYGGDVSRLAVAGESAGGNLALALGVAASWSRPEPFARRVWATGVRPRVLLPACGILDVHEPDRFADTETVSPWVLERIHRVCTSYLPELEPAAELASPLRFLESAPPPSRPFPAVFAPCGDRDPIADDTRRLARALARLEVPHEAPEYADAHHAFHAVFWRADSARCWADQDRFLERHLGPMA